jgi:hypothetical protein
VGIEPASRTAVFRPNAADHKAATREEPIKPFDRLEFAIADAAGGIAKAVASRSTARDVSEPPLEHGLDRFPTTMEAHRVPGRLGRRAEGAWIQAEEIEGQAAQLRRRGIDARGRNRAVATAWSRAAAALENVERHEKAGRRVRAAFDLFDPDGRLNDRVGAESEIAAALPDLSGSEWKKVRNFLRDRRGLNVLDRMHRRRTEADPDARRRDALAWRWWGRHGRPDLPADFRLARIQAVAWRRPLDGEEHASYDRVAAVLRDTFRASSAVECMNSVLRMQPSRHKRMTQAMLDLKRLDGNGRAFRSGPRKNACPYRVLGLDLPTFDFGTLLQTNPRQLTQGDRQLEIYPIAAICFSTAQRG